MKYFIKQVAGNLWCVYSKGIIIYPEFSGTKSECELWMEMAQLRNSISS